MKKKRLIDIGLASTISLFLIGSAHAQEDAEVDAEKEVKVAKGVDASDLKLGLYLNYQNQALHDQPGEKVTHDYGDAFTLYLAEQGKLKLTDERKATIEQRVKATPLNQERISIMLQRAALCDLQCGFLEGLLPRWTFEYIRTNVPHDELQNHLRKTLEEVIVNPDLEGSPWGWGKAEFAGKMDKPLNDRVNLYVEHMQKLPAIQQEL